MIDTKSKNLSELFSGQPASFVYGQERNSLEDVSGSSTIQLDYHPQTADQFSCALLEPTEQLTRNYPLNAIFSFKPNIKLKAIDQQRQTLTLTVYSDPVFYETFDHISLSFFNRVATNEVPIFTMHKDYSLIGNKDLFVHTLQKGESIINPKLFKRFSNFFAHGVKPSSTGVDRPFSYIPKWMDYSANFILSKYFPQGNPLHGHINRTIVRGLLDEDGKFYSKESNKVMLASLYNYFGDGVNLHSHDKVRKDLRKMLNKYSRRITNYLISSESKRDNFRAIIGSYDLELEGYYDKGWHLNVNSMNLLRNLLFERWLMWQLIETKLISTQEIGRVLYLMKMSKLFVNKLGCSKVEWNDYLVRRLLGSNEIRLCGSDIVLAGPGNYSTSKEVVVNGKALKYFITTRDRGVRNHQLECKYPVFPSGGIVIWIDYSVDSLNVGEVICDLLPVFKAIVIECAHISDKHDLVFEPDYRKGESLHVHVLTYEDSQFMALTINMFGVESLEFEYLGLRLMHKMCVLLMRLYRAYIGSDASYSKYAYVCIGIPVDVTLNLPNRYRSVGRMNSASMLTLVIKTIRYLMYNMTMHTEIYETMHKDLPSNPTPYDMFRFWLTHLSIFTKRQVFWKISYGDHILVSKDCYKRWCPSDASYIKFVIDMEGEMFKIVENVTDDRAKANFITHDYH